MNSLTLTASLIDVTKYSIGFPNSSEEVLLDRSNIISQIDDILGSNDQSLVLFLEGEENVGKTSICAEFAKRNNLTTISIFFNPFNIIDYTIDFFCSNIVYQLKFLLGEEVDLASENVIGRDVYLQYIFNVRKKFKGQNKKLIIVIDGLEDKVKDFKEFVTDLFSILPVGHDNFHILISGYSNDFKSILPKSRNLPHKSITMAGFSIPEIKIYLDNASISNQNIHDIYKITKGYPGRLKTLKRLIKSNSLQFEEIKSADTYKEWIDKDCSQIDLDLPICNAIISLLALADKSFTTDEISKIIESELDKVKLTMSSLTVLEETNNGWQFISIEYKKHFANSLRGKTKFINELLINFYSKNTSVNSLIELPKLYAEKNDWKNVVKVLNENYSKHVISETGSVLSLNQNLNFGLIASEKLKQFSDMYRFSLESSLINELNNNLYWESEVRARLAMRDFAGAISIAESAILKIDRLKLLALIARKEKEINNYIDEDLVNLINQLYRNADFSFSGDKVYDIVADLIYAIPNLAIEMIEKASGSATDENINDWIIAKLSVAAIDSSIKDNEDPSQSKKVQAIESINHPDVKKINKAISFLVGNYSGAKVIEEVKKLSDGKEKLRFLRLWLTNQKSNDKELGNVIESATDELVIGSNTKDITYDVLKELTDQLPYVKDIKLKDKLFYRFKEIENSLPLEMLSRNKTKYDLNIFHTEYTLDKSNSSQNIRRIFKRITGFEDSLMQLESYAECFSKLAALSYSEFSEQIQFLKIKINYLVTSLFKECAYHFKLIEYSLRVIAKSNPHFALEIAKKINLSANRDQARKSILESYLSNSIKFIKAQFLVEIESTFESQKAKYNSYIIIFERFSEAKSLPYEVVKSLTIFFDKLKLIPSNNSKSYGLVQLYKVISKNSTWKSNYANHCQENILNALKNIESEWERVDVGFLICSEVSSIDSEFGKKIFQYTKNIKDGSWIDSSVVAESYVLSVRLVIRSFAVLVSMNETTEYDDKIVKDLIARVPSDIQKLDLWVELGFLLYFNKSIDFAKNILNINIIPLLDDIVRKKIEVEECLEVFTFLHLFNSDIVKSYLKNYPIYISELVYESISYFYTTGHCPYDVYEDNSKKKDISFLDIKQAIAVLKNISNDSAIYGQVSKITKSILENKGQISRAQNLELINELNSFVSEKLPSKIDILHDGFKILCDFKIAKAKRDFSNNKEFYNKILERVNNIPNLSDIVFVKSVFLEEINFTALTNGVEFKQQLFEEIICALEKIPSHFEFVQRVIDISESMNLVNKNRWRDVTRKAFVATNKFDNANDTYNSQRKIIDTVYRIDADYAKELVRLTSADKDNYRFSTMLGNYFQYLELAKKIKNNETIEDREKANNKIIVQSIVNALKSLNSDKITAKKIAEAAQFLTLGSKLSLKELFPVYIYYLVNCGKTYYVKNANNVAIHRENFRKAVWSTNLVEILSYKKKGAEFGFRKYFIDEEFKSNKSINPGSREEAINYLSDWLKDNMDEYLVISDPYFKKEDLDILEIVNGISREVYVDILGCQGGSNLQMEEEFKKYWASKYASDPPFTNITFCWFGENDKVFPIHDRWVLTKKGGLRLGTSLSSLGVSKESEISIMNYSEALEIKENSLSEYIGRRKRSLNGEKISYRSFNLG